MSSPKLMGHCMTTAMGIMPHRDASKALDLALSMDIPFWPQLPNVSFHEDMYAQTSQGFPGVIVDPTAETVCFNSSQFENDLTAYSEQMNNPEYFKLGEDYSSVYHRFLAIDLTRHSAIRGQVTGPVSFGFRVVDEHQRPIIYDDSVRSLLFDFIQKKTNAQCAELASRNANAFVWLDEPGLGWVFSGMSGYNDAQAKEDYRLFLRGLSGVKALHLCANVNLPYLLELGIDLLSFDAFQIEVLPKGYAESAVGFLQSGGVISWGIVPTDSTSLSMEDSESLAGKLKEYWGVISRYGGISAERIAVQALIAPARCCLKNIGQVGAVGETKGSTDSRISTVEEQLVEKAFSMVNQVSEILKKHYRL
ncbi:MAG: hypothetical protein HYX87_08380 [Chloroflexi bacterium]|nr:hypothetical protein [Chloroflexota bacterium]